MVPRPNRRRFIAITASAAGLSLLPHGWSGAAEAEAVTWHGQALGARTRDVGPDSGAMAPNEPHEVVGVPFDEVVRVNPRVGEREPVQATKHFVRRGRILRDRDRPVQRGVRRIQHLEMANQLARVELALSGMDHRRAIVHQREVAQ